MDVVTTLTLIGVLIGILAGVAQILDYLGRKKSLLKVATPNNRIGDGSLENGGTKPNNLPHRNIFVGREREKRRVLEALASRSCVVSIEGVGGFGKTALALETAHACLDGSNSHQAEKMLWPFDAVVWVSAKDREVSLNVILDAVANTIEARATTRLSLPEKTQAIRRVLSRQRILLIVDNFETITDCDLHDFIANFPEPSTILITSREHVALADHSISIGELPRDDALELARDESKRLGLDGISSASDLLLDQFYTATGGSPLAIKWSLGQVKQKGQSIDSVLSYLYHARGSIFSEVFERSWSLLTTDAQAILMMITCFYSSVSRHAIEHVSNIHGSALTEVLGQLVEMSLVEVNGVIAEEGQRYDLHPLTRHFASAKLELELGLQSELQARITNYYIEFSKENGGIWNETGFDKLELEVPNLAGIISNALDNDNVTAGLSILRNTSDFLVIHGYWNDIMDLGAKAVSTNLNVGDRVEAMRFAVWPISWIQRHRGELVEAEEQLVQALTVFESFGHSRDIGIAKRNLGRVYQETNRYSDALIMLQDAYNIYHAFGDEDRHNKLLVTANLASILLDIGDTHMARLLCLEGLSLAGRHGDPMRQAHLLIIMGEIAKKGGEYRDAKSYWEEALTLFRAANRLDEIADTLSRLAYLQITSKAEAEEMLRKANDIYKGLGIDPKAPRKRVRARTQQMLHKLQRRSTLH